MRGKKLNCFPAVWVVMLPVFVVGSSTWGYGTAGVLPVLAWVAVIYCTGGVLALLLTALLCRGQISREDRSQPGYRRRYFLTMLKVFALWPGVMMMAAFFLFFRVLCSPAGCVAMVLIIIPVRCTWDLLPSDASGGLPLLVRIAVTYCTGGVLMAMVTGAFFWSKYSRDGRAQPGFWGHYLLTMLTVFAIWPAGILMAVSFLSNMIKEWCRGRP